MKLLIRKVFIPTLLVRIAFHSIIIRYINEIRISGLLNIEIN